MAQNWQEAELRDYLKVIVRYRFLIIGGVLISALVAGAISFIMPQIYRSSLLLEIGKLYLPPRDRFPQEADFIEDPASTARIIESDSVLREVRNQLQIDIPIRKLRQRINTETHYLEIPGSQSAPGQSLITISMDSPSAQQSVDFLTEISGIIVEWHNRKFDDNQQALQNRLENLQEQRGFLEESITSQIQHRRDIQESIGLLEIQADNYSQQMSRLDPDKVSPTEILFLQSAATEQTRGASALKEVLTKVEESISDNRAKLKEVRDDIVNIGNLINLSDPTRIRSEAVLPEEPIRPRKTLNILVGGVVGLLVTVVSAFLITYCKDV